MHVAVFLILIVLSTAPALAQTTGLPARVSMTVSPDGSREKALPGVTTRVVFPGEQDFYVLAPRSSWVNVGELSFDVVWPQNAPTQAQVMVHLKDWDFLWYQNLLPGYLTPGRKNHFNVSLSPENESWKPAGHYGAWHFRALMEPRQVGIRVFAKSDSSTTCGVENVAGVLRDDRKPPSIRNVNCNSDRVPCFEKFELTFELPDRYADPFEADRVWVTADFQGPTGRVTRVEGFYGQNYYREINVTGERIVPQGPPYWRVRFAPAEPGPHKYRIRVRDAFGVAEWGPGTFEATAARLPGFVRVSKTDPRYFEFDNGSAFFPIGHNIRSPFDTRADEQFPWAYRRPEGSAVYARYFKDMHTHGENIAEVWMAAWSLALEWTAKRPGFHGIGQYNMRNAWELDRVLDEAERNGIYINLVIHNHGKFGTFYDHEWEFNPFNAENGGYLKTPEDYFTDPRALTAFRKLMRYIIARWGYSTRVFAWELWSELNLTGSEARESNYRRPEVVEWHRDMGRAIKAMDPYDHLIGTHVSGDYTRQNKDIIALTEMDFCPIDAYHSSPDPLHIVPLMKQTAQFNNPFNKPVLITEFGGSHMAADVEHLGDTLHAGLWGSACIPLGGTPLFWWWQIIEEENFYAKFQAVSRFMDGEDRRDPAMQTATAGLLAGNEPYPSLKAECLKSDARALGWIYQPVMFETIDPLGKPGFSNVTLRVADMTDGEYTVEFWDTQAGKAFDRQQVRPKKGTVAAAVPPFARDIAFKIKPAGSNR